MTNPMTSAALSPESTRTNRRKMLATPLARERASKEVSKQEDQALDKRISKRNDTKESADKYTNYTSIV
jgi:hypothetical protein